MAGIVETSQPSLGDLLRPAAPDPSVSAAGGDLFPVADASRLHLDLTAVRFAGHYAHVKFVAPLRQIP